jgi:2-keto-4-pentenoate hydratase
MTVTATDQRGDELANAKGDALLGHPLNPVLWLIKDLAATDEKLQAGDLISLGSFARPQIPEAGQTVTVATMDCPVVHSKSLCSFFPAHKIAAREYHRDSVQKCAARIRE